MAALSTIERSTFLSYEAAIEQGLETFVEVGNALAKIRDSKLYREEFDTFEEYCKGRWQISRQSAYQFINAAEVAEDVRNCGQKIPATESQARPLASLPREERAEAWVEAVETAIDGKVTAKHVEQVVERRKAPSVQVDACASLPTPHQEAREDAGRRWSNFMHDIYQQLNSLRDCGGIKKLTREWPDKTRSDYAKELRRLSVELGKCLELLEGAA